MFTNDFSFWNKKIMNNNLKVSIIAAAYNEWDNLDNFFKFWLSQTYKNLELVIVNDWSSDNTEEVILYYQKKYPNIVKYIKNENNKWIWYSRYIWYKNASWEIIKFSDTDLADDYPLDTSFLERLVKPFIENEKIDCVFIDYQPFIDKNNIVRTLENLYYYAPVWKTPNNYENLKKVTYHMPTIFRNKKIDLSWIEKIKNWEDRFIARKFIENSRLNWKADWKVILDVNNQSLKELINRYIKYWKNSLWLVKPDKKLFILHILKPLVVVFSIFLFLLWIYLIFITKNLLFLILLIPLIWLYLFFLLLTIKYALEYVYSFDKKLFLKNILIWPFFLMFRYVLVFIWLIYFFHKK